MTVTLANPASFAAKDVLLKTSGLFSGEPTVVGFGPWGHDRSVSVVLKSIDFRMCEGGLRTLDFQLMENG